MTVNYKYASIDGEAFLTLFSPDGAVSCATKDTHANFDNLVALALAGDESVYAEADLGRAIQKRFDDAVEGRVAIRNGIVYFDDDPMDNALTKAIVDFHAEGEDFTPLVRFFENVMANPQPESREQFYRWVEHHDFPIDDEGNIVAYKSVYANGDGTYRSCHAGHAFVNGVEVNGYVVQSVGDVVTMPRSEVQHDPHVACHVGLHAGTYEYASTFSGDTLMHVKINPRDVVSVPHDCTSQKVRVCRYEVEGFAENEYQGARFRRAEDEFAPLDEDGATFDEWDEDEYLDEWEDEFLGEWEDELLGDDTPHGSDDRKFSCTSMKFRVGDKVKVHPRAVGVTGPPSVGFEQNLPGTYTAVEGDSTFCDNGVFAIDVDGTTVYLWDIDGYPVV